MTVWIAELAVTFLFPNGERASGRIAVGLPVQIAEGEAHCMLALDGIQIQSYPAIGDCKMQALLLAVQQIGMRLHDFLSRGGRVLCPDEDKDIRLDLFFGPLLREIPSHES